MKYSIHERERGLEITVHDAGERKGELLAAFGLCRAGECHCPTAEYEKTESIEVISRGSDVILLLKPKPEERLEKDRIEECLAFTFSTVRT